MTFYAIFYCVQLLPTLVTYLDDVTCQLDIIVSHISYEISSQGYKNIYVGSLEAPNMYAL